ncbi:MAG: stage II sporulation protein P [Peptococcaceae bacterium]|nr:stage II sporulation protein P [Peptococcaceae bacterium]
MYSVSAGRCRKVFPGRPPLKIIAILSLLLLGLIKVIPAGFPLQPLGLDAVKEVPGWILDSFQAKPLNIITGTMPICRWSSLFEDGDTCTVMGSFLDSTGAVGGVNFFSPTGVLQSQIPLLGAVDIIGAEPGVAPGLGEPGEKLITGNSEECLVCIYNTHTGETYRLTDGVDRLDGRQGGVVAVAAAFQAALEEDQGIKTTRSDQIHDQVYNLSYSESKKTARELLDAHPHTRAIFDIHRDSDKAREQSIINIDGQVYATLLFIVGSDSCSSWPGWRQNYAFAQELSKGINEKFPGLSQGVRVKEGLHRAYNQHLHPHAVLLEVGTTENSCEEAIRSVQLLAGVVAEAINAERIAAGVDSSI